MIRKNVPPKKFSLHPETGKAILNHMVKYLERSLARRCFRSVVRSYPTPDPRPPGTNRLLCHRSGQAVLHFASGHLQTSARPRKCRSDQTRAERTCAPFAIESEADVRGGRVDRSISRILGCAARRPIPISGKPNTKREKQTMSTAVEQNTTLSMNRLIAAPRERVSKHGQTLKKSRLVKPETYMVLAAQVDLRVTASIAWTSRARNAGSCGFAETIVRLRRLQSWFIHGNGKVILKWPSRIAL